MKRAIVNALHQVGALFSVYDLPYVGFPGLPTGRAGVGPGGGVGDGLAGPGGGGPLHSSRQRFSQLGMGLQRGIQFLLIGDAFPLNQLGQFLAHLLR